MRIQKILGTHQNLKLIVYLFVTLSVITVHVDSQLTAD